MHPRRSAACICKRGDTETEAMADKGSFDESYSGAVSGWWASCSQ